MRYMKLELRFSLCRDTQEDHLKRNQVQNEGKYQIQMS